MATEAQIAANRTNAQDHASGPTSPEGKAASSMNSTRHGLAGRSTLSLARSESDRALVEERMARFRPELRPEGAEEERLFEQYVVEQIRVERCVDAYFALCRAHGHRARLHWDDDRRREADDLAARLAREPHRVARRLEETRQGAELMLELWRGLASALDRDGSWTDAQRSLALDLLGVHPALRDAATPVDPARGDVAEARRAVVAREVARLAEMAEGRLAESDAHDRALAEATYGAELTKPLRLIDRYERAAVRRQMAAWTRLRELQSARSAPPEPSPRPRPASATSPAVARRAAPATVAMAPAAPRMSAAPVAPPVVAPCPVAATPAENRAEPRPSSRPLNRHQRRAMEAQARRAGR